MTVKTTIIGDRCVLYGADCLRVLRCMPSNSVDSIVCDPPAGVNFMGEDWDKAKGGRDAWIAWMQEIAVECLRVIKDGGHALVWALPRTSHWTGMAWENAGFEPRDRIAHLFGCLSEDTEILVNGEWRPYHKAAVGDLALCYDAERGTFAWQPIQETYLYAYNDTAFRIRSDNTDQIVTRNHRCLVERDGKFAFAPAETLAGEESIPVLKDMRGLLAALPVPHAGTSNAQPLVSGVQPQEDVGGQEGCVPHASVCVRELQTRVSCKKQENTVKTSEVLFGDMPQSASYRQARGAGTDDSDSQVRSVWLDGGEQSLREKEDDRRKESCVAGRCNARQNQGELQRWAVCSMPAGVCADVSEGWVCDGASAARGASHRTLPHADRSGASRRSQPVEQRAVEPVALFDEQGSQTLRASRFTTSDLARVEPFDLEGVVWCVRVPTGAFVARRNGKAFITGNSGMPKSHNLKGDWKGWGTALKPSAEDWWLLRKPIKTSVAANAAKHGTGALHIDACRVPYQDGEVNFDRKQRQQNSGGAITGAFGAASLIGTEIDTYKEEGRWPANTVLDGSEEVIEMFPSDNKGSFSRFFYCAKAGVNDREEGLEDLPMQTLAYSNGAQAAVNDGADEYTGGSQDIGFNNIKQRKNPHPTVKSTELMRYLARLITPADGVCLDPFMGSGSTGKACMLEGFRFIGIEKDPNYCTVAEARIRHAFEQASGQKK